VIGIPETGADGASFLDIAFDAVVDTIKQLPPGAAARSGCGREAVKRGGARRGCLQLGARSRCPRAYIDE